MRTPISKGQGRGILARSLSRVVLVTALAGSATPALAANLITDGSFEKPVVRSSQQFNTGDSFLNWTVVGEGYVTIYSNGHLGCGGNGLDAIRGNQLLNLANGNYTVAGVQTSIATTAGSTYEIAFFLGRILGSGGQCARPTTADLYIDGAFAGSFKIGGIHSGNWKKCSTQFTAQNATTTIAFMNGNGSSAVTGLDGISIRAVKAR